MLNAANLFLQGGLHGLSDARAAHLSAPSPPAAGALAGGPGPGPAPPPPAAGASAGGPGPGPAPPPPAAGALPGVGGQIPAPPQAADPAQAPVPHPAGAQAAGVAPGMHALAGPGPAPPQQAVGGAQAPPQQAAVMAQAPPQQAAVMAQAAAAYQAAGPAQAYAQNALPGGGLAGMPAGLSYPGPPAGYPAYTGPPQHAGVQAGPGAVANAMAYIQSYIMPAANNGNIQLPPQTLAPKVLNVKPQIAPAQYALGPMESTRNVQYRASPSASHAGRFSNETVSDQVVKKKTYTPTVKKELSSADPADMIRRDLAQRLRNTKVLEWDDGELEERMSGFQVDRFKRGVNYGDLVPEDRRYRKEWINNTLSVDDGVAGLMDLIRPFVEKVDFSDWAFEEQILPTKLVDRNMLEFYTQIVFGVGINQFYDHMRRKYGPDMTFEKAVEAISPFNIAKFTDFYIRSKISPNRAINSSTRFLVLNALTHAGASKDLKASVTLHMTVDEAMTISLETKCFRHLCVPSPY